jgi:pimeloyl-ACP methyl ester carboxylesterase
MEGDHTGEVLQSVAARVSELLPRGELVTLEGLDHLAPVRAPDVVARTIVAFVDRVAALESKG